MPETIDSTEPHVQLTLEQHGFELYASTYMQIIFNWPTQFKPTLVKGRLHGWESVYTEGLL